ncbi:efflux RND transporter periplasmic adaptor subunit [Lutibacter sp.]|uniref:efflux RND transporter periplasmic adaptor subunit n=1 Tax=Lutibacter sp. TaxID=1925666 RepID=UPI0025BFA7E5|nr:efflux RND transporter periplasmic adaptor subunit [Lutibacter sp.]MCF6167029.1 efflux RND transporter periplasmic adaptor subunit [Lutibacter sp.]
MKKNISKIIVLLLSIITISCTTTSKTEEATVNTIKEDSNIVEITSSQYENSKMELGKISKQLFTESIKTNGYVDVPPANRAKVSAIIGGYVKKSPLLVGDKVKKGQLLLTIENPDFIEIQQNYLEITEKLTYLKSEYNRQKTLFEEKITSQKNYLKAESDYKSALALSNGLSQKLKMININPLNVKAGKITPIVPIYAPISGSVTAVYTNVGEFMNASDVLLEIINNEHKHLELIVFEKEILKIREKQPILFKIPESSTKKYEAAVYLVGKSIDKNRTVRVHGHLKNEDVPFIVGMFVEAEIITNSIEKQALPIEAVLEKDGEYFVLVLKEKNEETYKFEKMKITIGVKNENWIEIIGKNLENKQILMKGAFLPLENG